MAGHSYVLETARQAPELGTYSIAWWPLDEGAAATNFIDGDAAFDLTQANSPTVVAGPRSTNGTSGARGFNGTTQWASRAHDAHETYFQSTAGWTLQAWVWIDPAMTTGTVVSFEAFASPETQATNIQGRLSVDSSRNPKITWEYGSGSNVITTASTVTLRESEWQHLAVVVDVDPENFDKFRATFYVNGDPVYIASNLTPPDGGTTAFWQIGAAIASSGDGGVTPGDWWRGRLADVQFHNRAQSWDFVRRNYARAIRDFDVRASAGFAAAAPDQLPHFETHVRMLVQDKAGTAPEHRYVGGWVDLSHFLGHNWIRSIRITDEIEAQARHASAVLSARTGARSLAATRVGADVIAGVSYLENEVQAGSVALLDGGTVVRIEAAVVPAGSLWALDRRIPWTGSDDHQTNRRHALDAHWMLIFEGSIISTGVANDEVTVEMIDKMGPLQDQWSEPNGNSTTGADMPLGSGGGTALETNLQNFVDWQNPARLRFSAIDDSGAGGAVVITFFQSSSTYPLGYGRPHLLQVGDQFEVTNTTNYNGVYTVASISGQTVTTIEVKGGLAAETSGIAWASPAKHGYIGAPSNRDGSHEIYVPTSPGWNQYTYTPGHSQPVATLLEEQAGQIQWTCRFVWDDENAEFRLTLCRRPSNSGLYLSPRLVRKVASIGYDTSDERNVVVVEYTDTSTADTDGNRGRRRVVAATRAAEVERVRRRYARVSLASANNIDTTTEANELADNIIDDCAALASPQMRAEMVFVPELDLGDVPWILAEYQLPGMSTDLNVEAVPLAFGPDWPEFAAIGIEHTFDAQGARTALTLRGLVSAASIPARGRKILDIVDGNGQVQGAGSTALDSTLYGGAPTCTALRDAAGVRGVFIRWTLPTTLARRWDYTEVHIDTTNNFTPTSATRDATVRGQTCTFWGLVAGTTYYVKVVHRDVMKNTLISSQNSFVA